MMGTIREASSDMNMCFISVFLLAANRQVHHRSCRTKGGRRLRPALLPSGRRLPGQHWPRTYQGSLALKRTAANSMEQKQKGYFVVIRFLRSPSTPWLSVPTENSTVPREADAPQYDVTNKTTPKSTANKSSDATSRKGSSFSNAQVASALVNRWLNHRAAERARNDGPAAQHRMISPFRFGIDKKHFTMLYPRGWNVTPSMSVEHHAEPHERRA